MEIQEAIDAQLSERVHADFRPSVTDVENALQMLPSNGGSYDPVAQYPYVVGYLTGSLLGLVNDVQTGNAKSAATEIRIGFSMLIALTLARAAGR